MGEYELPYWEDIPLEARKYINELIFNAARDAGFFLSLDDDDFGMYAIGEHGEHDVTPELVDFALNLLESFIAINISSNISATIKLKQ